MIITHKEFPNYKKYEIMYEGRPLSMEVGKLAELCNSAGPRKVRRDHRSRHLHRLRPPEGRHRLLPPLRGLQ